MRSKGHYIDTLIVLVILLTAAISVAFGLGYRSSRHVLVPSAAMAATPVAPGKGKAPLLES